MAREEYIRIYRSDVGGATPSLTSGEIAANLVDGKFFVGGKEVYHRYLKNIFSIPEDKQ